MGWARLDDRWHDHPKTINAGLEAAGLFAMCLTWAHQARRTSSTPGVVPDGVLARFAGTKAKKLTKVLLDVGYLDAQTDAGWPIHDFADYLPNYDPEQAKKNGSLGGRAKADKQTASKPLSEPLDVLIPNRVAVSSTRRTPVPKELKPSDPADAESTTERVTAQTVLGAWIDSMRENGTEPSRRMVGEVARTAKDLLTKNDPAGVLEAARQAGTAGYTTIDRQLAMIHGRRSVATKQRNPNIPEGWGT